MKNRLANWRAAAVGIVATWLMALPAIAAAPSAAQIVSIQGQGESRPSPDKPWREATVRQTLDAGATLRTLDASRMAVMLADQTQVRLAPNSVIEIKQVGDGATRATLLRQSSGRTWAQSKNIPDKLTLETPTAVAAIRGTDWEMVVDADGNSVLTVLSGEVQLSNPEGSVNVGAGQQGRAQRGQAPTISILVRPSERVQWVSSFTADPRRYADLATMAWPAPISTVQALADRPDALASVSLLLADLQVQSGDFASALGTLTRGATRCPADSRFDVWIARVLLLRDDVSGARTALARAQQKTPGSAEVWLAQGDLERVEGRASAALAAYRAAVAADTQEPALQARAWWGLGVVHTEREEAGPARESLQSALRLDPQGPGFLAEWGRLQALVGDLDRARATLMQALEARPDDFEAMTALALVELHQGHPEAATRQLLAATLIEPRYARAHTLLAVAYYQQTRPKDATFALERARSLDPNDPLPDLFQSMMFNDLRQPGEAWVRARRSLALLPFLKSLNPVANNQKGGANLGSALANLGLEDWARAFANDSYDPLWAGSHLFLADRYEGNFTKKSELFQGFLVDPTVFGASNLFSNLMVRPTHQGSVGLRHNQSADFAVTEPTVTLNGYDNSIMPLAYFAEAIRSQARPGHVALDALANTTTLALGLRPRHELGLFLYANAFNADLGSPVDANTRQNLNGRDERLDLGLNLGDGPRSQAWIKWGGGREASRVNQTTQVATPSGLATRASDFESRPTRSDLQWRHTQTTGDGQALSWGLDAARQAKVNSLVREYFFHIGQGVVPSDRLTLDEADQSQSLWVSYSAAMSDLRWQADLAWQRFVKTRDIQISRDRQPPVTQYLTEDYDPSTLAPRLGAAYTVRPGVTLRGAWQMWLKPMTFDTLAPVATAGIALDDSGVQPGGTLTRSRMQLDWELASTQFVTLFFDQKQVANLVSPLDGVLNTRADTANLDRLRQRGTANLAAPDHQEGAAIFGRGNTSLWGATYNQVVSHTLAAYLGYTFTDSFNTGVDDRGKRLPFAPEHRATLGLTWVGPERWITSAQAVWRSNRFADEANQVALASGWDMTLRMDWESPSKRWSVSGYAVNLLKPDTERLLGVQWVGRY